MWAAGPRFRPVSWSVRNHLSVSKTRALIQFAAVILNGFDGRGCLPTISMCWSLCMALFTSCHRTAQQFPFVSIDILSPSQKNKTPYFALHMETFSTDRFMLLYLALTHTHFKIEPRLKPEHRPLDMSASSVNHTEGHIVCNIQGSKRNQHHKDSQASLVGIDMSIKVAVPLIMPVFNP